MQKAYVQANTEVPGWNELDANAKQDWQMFALEVQGSPAFEAGKQDQQAPGALRKNSYKEGTNNWFEYELGYRVTDTRYIHG